MGDGRLETCIDIAAQNIILRIRINIWGKSLHSKRILKQMVSAPLAIKKSWRPSRNTGEFISGARENMRKKSIKKLEADIRNLRNEEGMEKLINLSYDRLADGSRRPYRPRKIDPETADAIRRIWA